MTTLGQAPRGSKFGWGALSTQERAYTSPIWYNP